MNIYLWQRNQFVIFGSGETIDGAREAVLDTYFSEIKEQYQTNNKNNITFFDLLKEEPVQIGSVNLLALDLSYTGAAYVAID